MEQSMEEKIEKLFARLLTSSVWLEDAATRLVWVTLLVLADDDGRVECSLPDLAREAYVSLGECEHALERLNSPDRHNREKVFGGRRIRVVDGGWSILV